MGESPGSSLPGQASDLLGQLPELLQQPGAAERLLNLALACHGRMLELETLNRGEAIDHALAGARLLTALRGTPAAEPHWVAVHEEQCCRYGAIWIHAALQQAGSPTSPEALPPATRAHWRSAALPLLDRLAELHTPPPAWIPALRRDLIGSPPGSLAVVGNCQAFPLLLGLRQALPESTLPFCPSVHLATADEVGELHQILQTVDVLVMHRVQPGYRDNIGLDTATLQALLAPGARCLVLPNLHYEGQLPWIAYAADPEGRLAALESESPLGPYHDFLAMAAAGRDLSAGELLTTPCPSALASLLQQAHRGSLLELQRREADCSVALSDWIARHHREQPIGHTINHPTQASLDALLRRLLEQLHPAHTLGTELFDSHEHLGELTIPIHPWVQQALGLGPWARSWGQRRGSRFAIEQQLAASLAFYQRHPWIRESNANHPKLAFAERCLDLLPGSGGATAPGPVGARQSNPRTAALINYFNDHDMLAWQLRCGCLDGYDRIYLWDGPYGYLHKLRLFPEEAPRLDQTETGRTLLADPRVVYHHAVWADEAEKRQAAYAAVEEEIVVLHDTDEFFHLDPDALLAFWRSRQAVASQRVQNLYAGGLHGSDGHHSTTDLRGLPHKRVVFKRAVISPERHLDYCWLVGVTQQPTDESLVYPEPLGHTYHLTACRTPEGQATKMAFYMALSLRNQPTHPVLERLEQLVQGGSLLLPEAQAIFLRGDPGTSGVPNPAFGLTLQPRLEDPAFPAEALDGMLAASRPVGPGRHRLLQGYPLVLWFPAEQPSEAEPLELPIHLDFPGELTAEVWCWRTGQTGGEPVIHHHQGSEALIPLPRPGDQLGHLVRLTLRQTSSPAHLVWVVVGLPRRLLFVLGAHRSGCGALAQLLAARGAVMPRSATALPDLHNRLLQAMGCRWADPCLPHAPLPEDAIDAGLPELEGVLAAAFPPADAGASWAVVSDPNQCRFLPLWQRAVETRNLTAAVVLVNRYPIAVVASLHRSASIPTAQALALWVEGQLEAELHSRPLPRVVVNYETLLRSPSSVLQALDTLLPATAGPGNPEAVVCPELDHSAQTSFDLGAAVDPRLLELALDVHSALGAASEPERQARMDLARLDWSDLRAHLAPPPPPRTTLQLFWSTDRGRGFSEAASSRREIVIGGGFSCHRLPLPPSEEPLTALRLDPAETPCTIQLRRLALHDRWGECHWHWNAAKAEETPAQRGGVPFEPLNPETQPAAPAPGEQAATIHCSGHDPAVVLQVPPHALEALQAGGTLLLEGHWLIPPSP